MIVFYTSNLLVIAPSLFDHNQSYHIESILVLYFHGNHQNNRMAFQFLACVAKIHLVILVYLLNLNGFVNHYPDFIIQTKSGKTVLLETKGDHLDAEQKIRLGGLWASKAGNDYRYFMVYERRTVDNAYKLEDFLKGIEMIFEKFFGVLKRKGIKEIEAQGQPFNPEIHEALMSVERDDVEEGVVVSVFQKGYTLHDRVIVAPKVGVSKKKSS